ncbi:sugar phosphate isomerase/epimerase family protein [Thermus thermamylovorans]|uniref:Sugar phosphate isomerase/epimerase n=1 Tax=Thermus thermamylovorans TaxID=2509362 RepID=A0A4Q9B717_9DEIN|nr:sugar phosphate isomerase/epimerase family protein [Thermus thermamylovorans]TBH21271.1 sugar phosphate isomerase/epimerase [Thermus thermamylovorans]
MRLAFSPFNAAMGYEEAFRLAAELGLDLEVAYDLHEALPLPDPKALRATGEALGVGFTLHLPFVEMNPASLIPSVRALSEERLKRALEFGEALGAKVGVLHTGQVPLRHPVALELAREALERTLAALLPLPFPVALENLALAEGDLLRGPEELGALLTRFPQYGFCLDVGHALVELGSRGPRLYQEALGPRLLHLHLHDNHGQKDDHLPVGAGAVPWEKLIDGLRGFPGTAALEVTGGPEGVRRSLSRLQSLLAP